MTSSPPRILVVDDVPEILQFFVQVAATLKATPVSIETANDPLAALALVQEREFDVVVSDFNMAHTDGLTILTAARARHPQGHRVLMTGYNEILASDERIHEAGLDGQIQKPMGIKYLRGWFEACARDDSTALKAYMQTHTG